MSHIPIFDIYGVRLGRDFVEDHPEFPQPRQDLGDLDALAAGIIESGQRDQAITVWRRGEENILLDGKRTVTAMIRCPELRKALGGQLPVTFWTPSAKSELTAEQQARVFMIRVNLDPKGQTSGRKLLTLAEEIEAARRLADSGMVNAQIGQALGFSKEHARQVINASETMTPELKKAAGDSLTPETPLGREQALSLAAEPPERQREAVATASKVVAEAQESGTPIGRKTVAQAIGHRTKDNRKEAKEKRRQAKVQDVQPAKPVVIKDLPQTPLEWCERVISELHEITDGTNGSNIESLVNHARTALAGMMRLKALLEEGSGNKRKKKVV